MTEPDHDMELVERLARIHADANTHARNWAELGEPSRRAHEDAMRAVLAELRPNHRPARYDLDPELAGLADVVDALNWQTDGAARDRILRYVLARWGDGTA